MHARKRFTSSPCSIQVIYGGHAGGVRFVCNPYHPLRVLWDLAAMLFVVVSSVLAPLKVALTPATRAIWTVLTAGETG